MLCKKQATLSPTLCFAPHSPFVCRERSTLADSTVVELWRDFADLGSLEHHAIDSGGTSAESIAEEVAQRLREGLLCV
jgi:hypothetical protein